MPVPGYQQQVRRQVTMRAPPDPRASRSGLAEGLQAAGSALGRVADNKRAIDQQQADSAYRIAEEEKRRWRAQEVTAGMGAWAERQVSISRDLEDARKAAPPGAEGYDEAYNAVLTDHLTDFLQQLPDDPDVRQRFEPLIANYGAQSRLREDEWQRRQRADWQGANSEKWFEQQRINIQTAPEPATLDQSFMEIDAMADGLDLDQTAREAVRGSWKKTAVGTFLQARIDGGDYQGARAAIESGQLDPYLDGKTRPGFLASADRAEHAAAIAAERDASQARQDAREAVKTVQAVIGAGAQPSAEQWAAAQGGQQYLPDAERVDFGVLQTQAGLAKATQGWTGDRLRRERDRLQAKNSAGKASQQEQVQLQWLGDRMQTVEKEEGAQLKDLAGKGTAGQLQVLQQLDGRDPASRFAVANNVRPGLGYVAGLPAGLRNDALNGHEIRKARPDDFGDAKAMRAGFDRYLGPALATLGGDADEVFALAWDVYAGSLNSSGGKGFNAKAFARAIDVTMGRQRWPDGVMRGGMAQWPGTDGKIWLPSDRSASEFATLLHRSDFAGAVYANGDAASKVDILKRFTPTFTGESDAAGRPIYMFISADGRQLQKKGGGAYRLVPPAR